MDQLTVNQEAEQLVYGPREESYSHPIVDFTTTAKMWSALINSHLGTDIELDAEMVAIMMAALKLSRLSRNPGHRDSIVDVCGYMATYERVRQAREEELVPPLWEQSKEQLEERVAEGMKKAWGETSPVPVPTHQMMEHVPFQGEFGVPLPDPIAHSEEDDDAWETPTGEVPL